MSLAALMRDRGRPTVREELSMADIAAELKEIYQREFGQPYPRPEPRAVARTADELTNHGLVLAALGRTEAARKVFAQALATHPGHPAATYNDGLLRWRTGALTDDRLFSAVEATEAESADYRRGVIHLERGDATAAMPLLFRASRAAAGDEEVEAAFRYVAAAERPRGLPPRTFQVRAGIRSDSLHGGPVTRSATFA